MKVTDSKKHCPVCGEDQPVSEFAKRSPGQRGGLQSYCRKCTADYMRNYKLSNRKIVRAANVRHRRTNYSSYRQGDRLAGARYRARNKTKESTRRARSRARKAGAPGRGVTAAEWQQVLEDSLGLCAYCNRRAPLTRDHIESLSDGGAHEMDNIAAACRGCNSSKFRKPLLVWLAKSANEKALRRRNNLTIALSSSLVVN